MYYEIPFLEHNSHLHFYYGTSSPEVDSETQFPQTS